MSRNCGALERGGGGVHTGRQEGPMKCAGQYNVEIFFRPGSAPVVKSEGEAVEELETVQDHSSAADNASRAGAGTM